MCVCTLLWCTHSDCSKFVERLYSLLKLLGRSVLCVCTLLCVNSDCSKFVEMTVQPTETAGEVCTVCVHTPLCAQ